MSPTKPVVRPSILAFAAMAILLLVSVRIASWFIRSQEKIDKAKEESAQAAPPEVPADWPAADFSEVRAYYFNPEGRLLYSVFTGGRLNESVTNKEGALLTKAQTSRLLSAITGKHTVYPAAMCFEPRHAFVFYNPTHRPVAEVDVCFECYGVEMTSVGMNYRADLPALADLASELKLPLHPDGLDAKTFRREFEESLRGSPTQ